MDPGWIFVIIILVGFVTYMIVGVIVKKFVFKSEGMEVIPNHSFWADLPGLVKDGAVYFFNKLT